MLLLNHRRWLYYLLAGLVLVAVATVMMVEKLQNGTHVFVLMFSVLCETNATEDAPYCEYEYLTIARDVEVCFVRVSWKVLRMAQWSFLIIMSLFYPHSFA